MAQRSLTPAVAHSRARVAGLSRSRGDDDPDLAAARTDLRAARLEAAIISAVEAAPPLSAAQRHRLAQLLGGA